MRNLQGSVFFPLLACVALSTAPAAQEAYRQPPREVVAIADASPTPIASPNPDGTRLLLVEYSAMPPITQLAEPILRLAGVRLTARTNDRQRTTNFTGISIRTLPDGREKRVVFPKGAKIGFPEWSPDGTRFALTNAVEKGTELWVVDAATGETRTLTPPRLNGALGTSFTWMPDSRTLLCRLVPDGRGAEPKAPAVPTGPRIEQTEGKVSPVRTYQDLLENAHDEVLFDHYGTSQLALVDAGTGAIRPLGSPGIYASIEPAPGGSHLLLTRLKRPYSHHVPYALFRRSVEVWDLQGRKVHTVADLPAAEEIPIEGVPTGPRNVQWRALEPATLVWAEALDGGDPKKKVPHRDRLFTIPAPFEGKPLAIRKVEHRFTGIDWLERQGLALVTEYDRDRRWRRTTLIDVEDPSFEPTVVWDLSIHDRYKDPGTPVRRTTPRGERVVRVEGEWIYLAGPGATPEGDRPFLDRFSLGTLKGDRIFRSEGGTYESFLAFIGPKTASGLTRRESPTDPPNYFVRDIGEETSRALTNYSDPAPAFTAGVRKQLIRYHRADGVPLSGTLYLPPGYRKGERLPLVLWAYPLEYTDASMAGQVRSAPNRFTFLRGPSHLFFLTQGYAVLDDPQLPVVGDPETMNDTFLEQIVSGAKAAIDAVVAMGVADPERVGIGGHSYGAFMTANLLAHSNLFRAGIARSGAYNRTLTPFGFQTERRTLWEAPDAYVKLSPLMSANKIDEPILLLHGEIDANPGTFPIQSERLYHAVKGHGATARLVLLPNESHGYQARESVLHALTEMFDWFDRYVKESPVAEAAGKKEGGRRSL